MSDIEIKGAKENNLKNIDLKIPHHKIIVLTGVSGCGKSSLAFGTLFSEGHRRYVETFSAYARQFLYSLEKPDVEYIEGLPPVIAIEQKTTSYNPRSTVGTVTEIYDFLRLLFAKMGKAKSHVSGQDMVSYTTEEVIDTFHRSFQNKKVMILAPVVRSRKGNYQQLLNKFLGYGFVSANINGKIIDIEKDMSLSRYQNHDIDIVIDKVVIGKTAQRRVQNSLEIAMKYGDQTLKIYDLEKKVFHHYSRFLMCPSSGISYPKPEPNLFSFNSMVGQCPKCKGLGQTLTTDHELIFPDEEKSLSQDGIAKLSIKSRLCYRIKILLELYGLNETTPIKDYPPKILKKICSGEKKINFHGLDNIILDIQQNPNNYSEPQKKWARDLLTYRTCKECQGQRLNLIARHFFILEQNIIEVSRLSISELYKWVTTVEQTASDKERVICTGIITEVKTRLQFILDVGLNYLSVDRPASELSGGEAQRIRLATQIGSQLMGILYILDEPSIGLHQRDNEKLIHSLKKLRDIGNSIIVVEHDKDIMIQADEIIEIGPGPGKDGGQVIAQGKATKISSNNSPTLDYLFGRKSIHVPKQRRIAPKDYCLKITHATGHNLKKVDLTIPLGVLNCITGVSGSGKSTLINHTLFPILHKYCYGEKVKIEPLPYQSVSGLALIDKVINVDQKPIGRTPRSNPATYTKMFDEIRQLFTKVPQAKARGFKSGNFSFNVKGGRCENCKGYGKKMIKMDMLPDVAVLCDACQGKRFERDILTIKYKNMSINDVLNLSVDEAAVVFEKIPNIYLKIKALQEVGLGYITLGQSSTTISGGEAQRIKLAKELAKIQTQKTVYILDEPTTGLHFQDIDILMQTLQKLVDLGNTVIIIEHNMDVIKTADHLIDIGPEGGMQGGEIIFEGTPEDLAKVPHSHTGRFLKSEL